MHTIDKKLFLSEVLEGRVREFRHSDYSNVIGYNYTEECQFSKLWNETNILCRGLIFNNETCIARPFSKFFNIEEVLQDLSNKKLSYIQVKEDGSLIISYYFNNKINFATRGSFHSDQAKLAQNLWQASYCLDDGVKKEVEELSKKNTLLFELVGPSNINVSRGYKQDELILLSIINIETGIELPRKEVDLLAKKIGCTRPVIFEANSIDDLYQKIKENKDPNFEGVVVTFHDGLKVKIKSNLYVQLHKVITGTLGRESKFAIWKDFKEKGNTSIISDLKIPDEFFSEITKEINLINHYYDSFFNKITFIFSEMKKDYNNAMSRKDMALKWQEYRWLLSPLFLNQEDISSFCLKIFKKNYMDGLYE